MKILVLMPLDEQHVFAGTGIYKYLTKDAQDHCFCMPMYMQYDMSTKRAETWMHAMFDAIIAGKEIYDIADRQKDDLIIIGNLPDTKFDVVFNFQDIEESLPYEDKFLEKVTEIINESSADDKELLSKYITNMHTADESTLALRDCTAAAKFLAAYLETDPHLEDIVEKYKNANFKILENGVLKHANTKIQN